jgi:hypothetical protein
MHTAARLVAEHSLDLRKRPTAAHCFHQVIVRPRPDATDAALDERRKMISGDSKSLDVLS